MERDEFYERRNRERDEFERQLYAEWPEVEEAARSVHPPEVRLDCPKGHKLLTVTLYADHNWHLSVVPVREERLERGRQVATSSAPGGDRPMSGVCAEPGCPVIVNGSDYCADHMPAGYGRDETQTLKTELVCPHRKCTYTGNHTQVTLLKLYAVAVRYNLPSIALPS